MTKSIVFVKHDFISYLSFKQEPKSEVFHFTFIIMAWLLSFGVCLAEIEMVPETANLDAMIWFI